MIKFWKSAGLFLINSITFSDAIFFYYDVTFLAKGKSGCPVRPPETNTTPSIETVPLDTEIDIDGKYFCSKYLTIPMKYLHILSSNTHLSLFF